MDSNGLNEAASSQSKSSPAKPGIEWRVIAGRDCLFLRFGSYFTEADAKTSSQRWKKEFNKKTGKNIILVWECLKMQGYEKAAREIWQNTVNEHKKNIERVYIITGSNLISAGADFMGVFKGIQIIGVKSLAELKKQLIVNKGS